MEAILNLIAEKLKNPIALFITLVAGIGTFLGALLSAYDFLSNFPPPWNWVLAIGAVVAAVVTFIVFFALVSFRRKYRIPIEQRYLLTEVEQSCDIKQNGERHYTQRKTFLFFKPPRKEDLFDNQITSVDLDITKTQYNSPDARLVDTERAKNILKIFWEPIIGSVEIAKPYTHEFSCIYPKAKIKASNATFITYSTSVFVGKFTLRINSALPVEKAVAVRSRFGLTLKSPDRIVSKALTIKQPLAPPIKMIDAHTLEWCNEKVSAGEMYFLIFYFARNP